MVVASALGLALSSAVMATSASAAVKVPANGVETPPTESLIETGSTLLYPLFNLWVPGYNQTYPGVTIQTGGTGSGTGISDATNGTADIGASDAYLAPSNVSASPGLKNIPLAISSQLVTYNIPGVSAHLKLSGSVLSQIYQGKITNWNNSAITALNTGVTLPNLPIVTLHRADSSGDTFLFTQFLSKTDPSGWGATVAFNTTVQWPNAPGALGETGNSGMVTGCKATPGCIAYVGHQLPDPGPPGRPRLRLAGERQEPVRGADRGVDLRGSGRLHQEDAGQRHHLADLRAGQGWLPDRELRVRHRRDPPSQHEQGQGHPLAARVGHQRQGRERSQLPVTRWTSSHSRRPSTRGHSSRSSPLASDVQRRLGGATPRPAARAGHTPGLRGPAYG